MAYIPSTHVEPLHAVTTPAIAPVGLVASIAAAPLAAHEGKVEDAASSPSRNTPIYYATATRTDANTTGGGAPPSPHHPALPLVGISFTTADATVAVTDTVTTAVTGTITITDAVTTTVTGTVTITITITITITVTAAITVAVTTAGGANPIAVPTESAGPAARSDGAGRWALGSGSGATTTRKEEAAAAGAGAAAATAALDSSVSKTKTKSSGRDAAADGDDERKGKTKTKTGKEKGKSKGEHDLKTGLAFIATAASAAFIVHKTRKMVFGEDEEEKLKGKFKDAVEGRDRDRDRDWRSLDRGSEEDDRYRRRHQHQDHRRDKSPDVLVIEERFRNGRQEGKRVFDNGRLVLDDDNRRYNIEHGGDGGGRGAGMRDPERLMLDHRPSVPRLPSSGRYYDIDGSDDVLYEDRLMRRYP
ncbi:hypothetical protein SLS62_001849 [Diatrype stigma]|uniref:Uncharacterized protein n=1 Tax=Diatrype stigma TaxID=117547 RepID=A0AAN9V802_9PEZI